MAEERTREDYLHKIGELEDVIEVQEHTIAEMQKVIDKYVEKAGFLEAQIYKQEEEQEELLNRIAQMRELNDKMYVLFAEASWRIRQYEAMERVKRFNPFEEGKKE